MKRLPISKDELEVAIAKMGKFVLHAHSVSRHGKWTYQYKHQVASHFSCSADVIQSRVREYDILGFIAKDEDSKWESHLKKDKVCACCDKLKSWESFAKKQTRKERKDVRPFVVLSFCSDCRSEKNRKYNKLNGRKQRLRRRYGMTEKDYQLMLKNQNGTCAICNEKEKAIDKQTGKIKALSVDHSHVTGAIRGLLCQSCNVGIGQLDDNIERMNQAIKYLKLYS
ncbi:endonuclease VII domain-containing protein [bacterium]|nr:endonuclease VII domain-containing protein [bacterium]